MTKETAVIQWLSDVEEHNYPAAVSYLSIIYTEDKVAEMIVKLVLIH